MHPSSCSVWRRTFACNEICWRRDEIKGQNIGHNVQNVRLTLCAPEKILSWNILRACMVVLPCIKGISTRNKNSFNIPLMENLYPTRLCFTLIYLFKRNENVPQIFQRPPILGILTKSCSYGCILKYIFSTGNANFCLSFAKVSPSSLTQKHAQIQLVQIDKNKCSDRSVEV